MITRDTNYSIQHLRGLSADSKPLDVPNGSSYLEMDTGKKYLFDAQNSAWLAQGEQGGDSGGGVFIITWSVDSETGDSIITPNWNVIVDNYNNGKLPILYVRHEQTYAYLHSIDNPDNIQNIKFVSPALIDERGVHTVIFDMGESGISTDVERYPA